RSSDEEQVRKMADELLQQLSVIPGTIDIRDDEIRGGPEYVVRLKERNSAVAGLRESNVGLDLRTALEGFEAAELVKGGNDFKVRIQFDEARRRNLGSLEEVQILNSRGNLIPLQQIAEIQQFKGPSVRRSFDFKRSITITGEVDPRVITATSLNARAREMFTDLRIKYPQVSAVYGGEDEATKESLTSLGLALLAAVFLIFATLVFTFRSFTKPFLILSSIPLGLIGVCYAFVLDQRPLSFLAFVGVVGLSGVVINSAIILVDYIDELRREMKHEDLAKVLVLASGQRLRAVLATVLTTVVGLLPSAFGWGGYDPILVPMCLALSWGMIVGTLLALIWIPVGYLVLEELKDWALKKARSAKSSLLHSS
ncbi:MAG: efflux RND transporter permease subunit, partial [Bdellovibrio sp.]